MLVIADIKTNKEAIITGLIKKRLPNAEDRVEEVIQIDEERKIAQATMDKVLAEMNQISKQIGLLMKQGNHDEAALVKEKTARLKQESKELGDKMAELQDKLKQALYNIPNAAHDSVPEGNTDEDNEIVFEYGEDPKLPESAKPHWDLIKQYDIIDFELGTKITGAGFPVYKGQGARIQRALINFFLEQAIEAGYLEIQPPIVVNQASGYATGQLPDKEGQMYHIGQEDFYLIPTAEVPLTNIYRDVILDDKQLPIKNVGYTPCFRREAGSWGAHVRGLNRLHQFDKVEIVQIHKPENSYAALDEMSQYIQSLLKKLGLKYRVLRLCGGDLGFTSTITYDMEVYSAAQEKWLEVSSVSNFESYQANRLKLRYKDENKKMQLLHTLNGSALALPRILAAILENNQTEEGIVVPEVLRPYTRFDMIK